MQYSITFLLTAAILTWFGESAFCGDMIFPNRPAEVVYAKIRHVRPRIDYNGPLIMVDADSKWVVETNECGEAPGEVGDALAFGVNDIEGRFGAKAEVLAGRIFIFTGLPLAGNNNWLWTIKPGPLLLTGEWEAVPFKRKEEMRGLSQENLIALAVQLKPGLTQNDVRALTAAIAPNAEQVGIGSESELGIGVHEVIPSSDGSGISMRIVYDHRLRIVTWNLCHPIEKKVKKWITDDIGVLEVANYAARVQSVVKVAEFKGEAFRLSIAPQWVVTFQPYAEFSGTMPDRLTVAIDNPSSVLGRAVEETSGMPFELKTKFYWHRGVKKRLFEVELAYPVPNIPGHPQMIMTEQDVQWIASRLKAGMKREEIGMVRSMTGKSGLMGGRGGRNMPTTLDISADDGSGSVLEMVIEVDKLITWTFLKNGKRISESDLKHIAENLVVGMNMQEWKNAVLDAKKRFGQLGLSDGENQEGITEILTNDGSNTRLISNFKGGKLVHWELKSNPAHVEGAADSNPRKADPIHGD